MSFDTAAFFRGKTPAEQAALRTNTRRNEFALYNERANAPLQSGFMQLRNQAAQQELQAGQQGRARAAEAELVKMVQSSPDPAAAYPQALQRAQAMGIDTSQLPEEYDPQFMQGLEAVYAAPPEKLTEFERKLTMTPEHLREQALMIDMGIIPDANARLRGEMGDRVKPTSSMVEYGFARDQGFDGSFEDWKKAKSPADYERKVREAEAAATALGYTGEERKQFMERQLAKSGGVSVTTPDGTTVTMGGQTAPVGKAAKNETEKSVIADEEILQKAETLGNVYDPEFLTWQGQADGWWSRNKEKAGIDLSEAQKQRLKKKTKFRQAVNGLFNAYRKEITGAAAAMSELESLKKAMLNEDMSPSEFEAAYELFVDEGQRAIRLKRKFLREGIEIGDEFSDEFTGGSDDDWQARGAELEAQGLTDEAIIQRLRQEGYSL